MSSQIIYPARRAIERTLADAYAQPVRLFARLLPVWRVEIRAEVHEGEPYEVFDRFLTRGIAAGLATVEDLVSFFGVDASIVDRALRSLVTLRHVRRDEDALTLTDLGQRSVRDGVRYCIKEDRRHLYFDGFAGEPLPASHYGVTYLSQHRWRGPEGTDFHRVGFHTRFEPAQVQVLLQGPDRRDFNVPDGLRDAAVHSLQDVWLPAYLIQDAGTTGMRVFTMAGTGPDIHLEQVCAHLADALNDEPDRDDPASAWRDWLAQRGYPDVGVRRTNQGPLRAVLPASAFTSGRFKLYQLGSFETRFSSFLQLWCDDRQLRRTAVLDRVPAMIEKQAVRSRAELSDLLGQRAGLLLTRPPTTAEVRDYLCKHADAKVLARFDELA